MDAIAILGEDYDEPATYGDRDAGGAIYSDDPPPSISISDASPSPVSEGDTTVTFTVTLSAPYGAGPLTVHYSTGDGTASADSDYTAKLNQELTFPVGETSMSIVIDIREDSLSTSSRK